MPEPINNDCGNREPNRNRTTGDLCLPQARVTDTKTLAYLLRTGKRQHEAHRQEGSPMTTQDTNRHTFPAFPGQKRYATIYARTTTPHPMIWNQTDDEQEATESVRTLAAVPGVLGAYVFDRQEGRRIATANDVTSWAGPTLFEESVLTLTPIRQHVTIIVEGGIARIEQCPDGVDVEIRDLDEPYCDCWTSTPIQDEYAGGETYMKCEDCDRPIENYDEDAADYAAERIGDERRGH